jgi:hypothetical protein
MKGFDYYYRFLGDDTSQWLLRHCTENLAHHDGRGRVVDEGVGAPKWWPRPGGCDLATYGLGSG